MQCGFTAEKDNVGNIALSGKCVKPGIYCFKRESVFSMLLFIYITVSALKVAVCKNMEKNIGGIFLNSTFHYPFFLHFLYFVHQMTINYIPLGRKTPNDTCTCS